MNGEIECDIVSVATKNTALLQIHRTRRIRYLLSPLYGWRFLRFFVAMVQPHTRQGQGYRTTT